MNSLFELLQNLFSSLSTTTLNTIVGMLGIIAGTVPYVILITRSIRYNLNKRRLLYFWSGFSEDEIKIVFTEYTGALLTKGPIDIVGITGDSRVISKGVGFAISHIYNFLEQNMPKLKIKFTGQENVNPGSGHFVIIGTPIANEVSRFFLSKLKENYIVPFDIYANEKLNRIEIRYKNDVFSGRLDDSRTGEDFALIAKFRYGNQWIILVMGSLTYGSYEGVRAITDAHIIKDLVKIIRRNEGFAFIVQTDIYRDKSLGPKLIRESFTTLAQKHRNNIRIRR